MEFGISNLSIIPVRFEPDDKAEMTTQILFGELIVVTDTFNNWLNIRLVYDNYEGWINKNQFFKLSEDEFKNLNNSLPAYTLDLVNILNNKTRNTLTPIVLGSALPNISNSIFFLNGDEYSYEGSVFDYQINMEKIIENALMYINTPYLWGGRSPFGIDCSGFTQMVYKISGIKLLRDASQQATQGETVNFISEAKPGNLVFFDDDEGEIIHTGILLPENKIIHASGHVRIDTIDHNGIFNSETKKYTHKLRLIKKLI